MLSQLPGRCSRCHWRGTRETFDQQHKNKCQGPSAGTYGLPAWEYRDLTVGFVRFGRSRIDDDLLDLDLDDDVVVKKPSDYELTLDGAFSLASWMNCGASDRQIQQELFTDNYISPTSGGVEFPVFCQWYVEHRRDFASPPSRGGYGMESTKYMETLAMYRRTLEVRAVLLSDDDDDADLLNSTSRGRPDTTLSISEAKHIAANILAQTLTDEQLVALLPSTATEKNKPMRCQLHTLLRSLAERAHVDQRVMELLDGFMGSTAAKNEDGRQVLHVAVDSGEDLSVIRVLLAKGVPVDGRTSKGRTAMHLAATLGATSVIELLLDHEATIDAVTPEGWTALHVAVYCNHIPAAKLLLERGSNVNALTKQNRTPLHLIAGRKDGSKMAELLIQKKAKITAICGSGYTPLHLASAEGNGETVALLLEHGADPDSTTLAGDSAWDLATGAKCGDALRVICDHQKLREAAVAQRRQSRARPQPVSTDFSVVELDLGTTAGSPRRPLDSEL